VHGTEEAEGAKQAAEALFAGGGDISAMPTVALTAEDIEKTGLRVLDLLVLSKLCTSKSDARRMIEGGGVSVNDGRIDDLYAAIDADLLSDGAILKKGKKGFVRLIRG